MSSREPNAPIVLIDGVSYLKSLLKTYSKKEHIDNSVIIHDFTDIVRTSIKQYNPSYAVVLLPSNDVNFTLDAKCIIEIKSIVNALGIPVSDTTINSVNNIICSLVNSELTIGKNIILSTTSNILLQLINENISIENNLDKLFISNKTAKEKLGVQSSQIPDLLALVGDKDSEITSIPKVGFKHAIKWLNEYTTLDNIIKNISHINGPSAEELKIRVETVILNKKKATIELSKSNIDEIELDRKRINTDVLYPLYIKNKFYKWLPDEIKGNFVFNENKEKNKTSLLAIKTSDELNDLIETLKNKKSFSFFIEKSASGNHIGIGISYREGEGFYIPFISHSDLIAPFDVAFIMNRFKPLLESTDVKKVSFDSKELFGSLGYYDIELNALVSDAGTLAYTLNTANGKKNLEQLVFSELNQEMIGRKYFTDSQSRRSSIGDTNIDAFGSYVAEKADMIFRLNRHLYLLATKDIDARRIYEKFELPLISVLSEMEKNGVSINAEQLIKISKDFQLRMNDITDELYSMSDFRFNIDSPPQVGVFLFDVLKLPVQKKTDGGSLSTSEDALIELAKYHKAPTLISEYRSLSKLKSTFADGLIDRINKKTGKLHSTFNQTITTTGRLSSSDPNLQNIPIKTEDGRKIRRSFIPSSGNYIVAADYSQIELRVLAHLSGDERLQMAFNSGEDIHRATAAEVFGVHQNDVTKEQRRSAKAINFGLIYGMSASGLSSELDISWKKAQEYIDLYFSRYPGVLKYMNELKRNAHINGFVTTISGRKIYIKDINSENLRAMKSAERAATNAPMQGSAAEIIKKDNDR